MDAPTPVPASRTVGPDGNVHDDAASASESGVIAAYLIERVAEFRQLVELRRKGWSNPEGDAFFQRQRRQADEASGQTAAYFFRLMKAIGQELHRSTEAFAIRQAAAEPAPCSILDMCMAPGGFLQTAMAHNPGARAVAFSLPVANGGHKVLLPQDTDVELNMIDVTMLAADMGVGDGDGDGAACIPADHADAANFLPRHLERGRLFDLVLCDGQVLRTHVRPAYRERREAHRLTGTQLALGLEHVRPGGTMIVLLHKVESLNSARLLRNFCRFSSVRLFKPTTGHAKRSSFYMVATDIQSRHPEALRAVQRWKAAWKAATFGTDDEYVEAARGGDVSPEQLLDEFGPELVRLGRDVWRVQAKALEKAPFIKGYRRSNW